MPERDSDKYHAPIEMPALKVKQWLPEWDKVTFDEKSHRRKPSPQFYMLSMSARDLLSLSAIERRSLSRRAEGEPDLGIQRRHETKRSNDILKFVQSGHPWSELSEAQRETERFSDLRKPGWLPSAIIVNILTSPDRRRGFKVEDEDRLEVVDTGPKTASVRMPFSWTNAELWLPKSLAPIEVIDGQHRLLAFENAPEGIDMELPVVAFYGLDVSWQAYLFWMINIKPKRINPSLAFDLYPLLRTESWLEGKEGISIYKDTRSQELTEALWSHPLSPWHGRVNMLGEPGQGGVSQAAWIHSLSASYVKSWDSNRSPIGGLFGNAARDESDPLPWSRMQQAAFLIKTWQLLENEIRNCDEEWAQSIRLAKQPRGRGSKGADPAFSGAYSLLNTDQGVRAVLHVTNDLCFLRSRDLQLEQWVSVESSSSAIDDFEDMPVNANGITVLLKSLDRHPVSDFLHRIASALSRYDWRTSSFPNLDEDSLVMKQSFRGSGGYRALRRQLLIHLEKDISDVAEAARKVREILEY
jgi:hypothetical protein